MKAIIYSSVLATIPVILTGCVTGPSSQGSAAPTISDYSEASAGYHLK